MSIDVEQSIDGFVKAIGRNEILPFLGIYQNLISSYFKFKKYELNNIVTITIDLLLPFEHILKILLFLSYRNSPE